MSQFDCLDRKTHLLGHHVLEASAGTGKTFAIEHLVTRFILDDFKLSEILVVTFTRASTRDLKQRIYGNLKRVLEMLKGPSENMFDYVSEALEHKKEVQKRIEQAVSLMDEVEIFTIHSFCHRMLAEFAFEANRGFGDDTFDESDATKVIRAEVSSFFRHDLTETKYSPAQLGHLFHAYKQNFQQLVRGISALVMKDESLPNLPHFEESYIAFQLELKNLSGRDLRKDFYEIAPLYKGFLNLEKEVKEKWTTQVDILENGGCTRVEFDLLIKGTPFFGSLLTKENLKRNKDSDGLPYLEKLGVIIKEAADHLNTLIRIANECRSKVKEVYEREEVYPPDEVLKQMRNSLSEPQFKNKIQEKYRAVIIDEFQDTDPIQWQIFHHLFIGVEAFYLVGDPKQSIYSFRGADLYTYLNATNAQQEKRYLETNYRSEPAVIEALNTLFSNETIGNWLFLPSQGRSIEFRPAHSRSGVENTDFEDGKGALHFFMTEGEKKRSRKWPTPQMEEVELFPFIAKEMQSLVKAKKCIWSDFAILVRDRFQLERLRSFLTQWGIPSMAKGEKLLKDTLSFSLIDVVLDATVDPFNQSAVRQLLSHPFYGHTHRELIDGSWFQEATARFHTFHRIARDEGFTSFLKAFLASDFNPKQEMADFYQIIELLLEDSDSVDLLGQIEYLKKIKEMDVDVPVKYKRKNAVYGDMVTMMTIHMSKGLEFEIVFALGLATRYSRRDPLIKKGDELIFFNDALPECKIALQEEDSEKMRQLYVALTRAKKRVYVPLSVELNGVEMPVGGGSPTDLLQGMLMKKGSLKSVLSRLGFTFTELGRADLSLEKLPDRILVREKEAPPEVVRSSKKQIYSFTSLSKPSRIEHQTRFDKKKEIPLGSETGTLIHSLFETLIDTGLYVAFDSIAVRQVIKDVIENTHLQGWDERIYVLLDRTLNARLNGEFCLRDVDPNKMMTEMEFLFPFQTDYLKGFVDLVFQIQGKYYLIDWKTTWLDGYSQSKLRQAMEHGDYFKQAQVYVHALKNYLEIMEKRPFKECFGGVLYLFVRGLDDDGVYFEKEFPDLLC